MTTSSAIPTPSSSDSKHEKHEVDRIPTPSPKLRLHLEEITNKSSKAFIGHIPDLLSTVQDALSAIVASLYTPPPSAKGPKGKHVDFIPSIPPTRSVTFILRDMSGVAYTKGTELDNDHKEIHISLSYVQRCEKLPDPAAELRGVITHELVHCYQHSSPDDSGSVPRPPSGLIEGIADFVRLKAGLVPPHWKHPTRSSDLPDSWSKGYQDTAFFLEWMEDVQIGVGAVGMINDRLLRQGYVGEDKKAKESQENPDAESFWKGLFGVEILELWEEYGRYIDSLGNSG